jgi:hypothetical protein
MSIFFKVKEVSVVTDENLEEQINHFVGEGWKLDCIQFAMRESSKRPAMAFIIFYREHEEDEE